MSLHTLSRAFAALIGTIWSWIEPTVPFLTICVFAILLDCLTAWRLNRRLYAKYREQIKANPKAKIDGKLKSNHMFKMINDMAVVFLCVILAYHIDNVLLDWGDLHLAQTVCAVFCVVQFVSILENESCASDAKWAKLMQKIVQDKAERHLGVKIKELTSPDPSQGGE